MAKANLRRGQVNGGTGNLADATLECEAVGLSERDSPRIVAAIFE
jgi:hypothetical protein